jgi:uncharacterized protein (DUF342 family)
MSGAKPKLSFIPKQARVRCEFTRAQCLADPDGAEAIIDRAKSRMRAEKAKGHVAFYRIFATRLRSMWRLMAEQDEPIETTVAVTVAAGAPDLPGLVVEPMINGTSLGWMSIEAPAEAVREWQPFFVKLTVGKRLRDAGIEAVPNPAQMHRLWHHASAGRPVIRVPIQSLPASTSNPSGSPYRLFEDSSHQDVSLLVYDVNRMLEKDILEDLTKRLSGFCDRMNSKGSNYQIQFEEIIRTIRSGNRGPERYGLDLPMVLLAAFDKNRWQVSANSVTAATARAQPAQIPVEVRRAASSSEPKLSLIFAPDEMEAKIGKFDLNWYSTFADGLSPAWVVSTAEAQGVKFGITPEIRLQLNEMLDHRKSLEGFVIARGQVMEAGSDPYVHKTFEDITKVDESSVVALRERQRHKFVNRGQVVAEIRFKKPAKDRITVRGKVVPAEQPRLDGFQAGEGVSLQNGRLFVATVDGVPQFSDSSVAIIKGLVHEGNVDLSSGNIRFDGDVTITGSIETGAIVEVTGNLNVKGSIIGGEVKVAGNLVVEGGISGVGRVPVKVTGDVTAAFIENSKLRVRGSVVVQRSIVTSEVHAGAAIEVIAKDGQVVGSQLYAEQTLTTAYFGKSNGASTEAYLGCSHSAERSFHLKAERLHRLNEQRSKIELKVKLLQERPEHQKTERHRADEVSYNKYLERLTGIAALCEERVQLAKERVRHNKDALAKISETMAPGSRVTIAGKRYICREAVAGVVVRLHQGSIKIDALEDGSNDKKAS